MLVCDIIFAEEFIIILGAGGGGLNTPYEFSYISVCMSSSDSTTITQLIYKQNFSMSAGTIRTAWPLLKIQHCSKRSPDFVVMNYVKFSYYIIYTA